MNVFSTQMIEAIKFSLAEDLVEHRLRLASSVSSIDDEDRAIIGEQSAEPASSRGYIMLSQSCATGRLLLC